MPIKLEDLTCEKCIYSADKGDRCRLHQPETHVTYADTEIGFALHSVTKQVEPTYWCGDGEWPVVVKDVKSEHYISHIKLAKRRDLYCTPDLTYEWPEE